MALIKMEKKHIKPVSRMLTNAFKDDFADIFPDPEERKIKEPYAYELLLRWNFAYSLSYLTSERLEGIAMWKHSSKIKKMPPWHILTSGSIWQEIRIGRRAIREMDKAEQCMEKKQSELAPFEHWYLSVLAVDPVYQHQGYGSQLLRGMLTRIDKEGLPCYIETEGQNNIEMYRHFGFEVIDEYLLPSGKDKLTAMLRQPLSGDIAR